MIIIINGPCGIGKTETSWALLERFERGVMLDGDYIGAVQPFQIYDASRVEYLYQTLRLLVDFHRKHGYTNFVINYVFEEPASLARLQELLAEVAGPGRPFRLTCTEAEIERRIRARGGAATGSPAEALAWELRRFRELVAIQEAAAQRGNLGQVIDTTHLTIQQVADAIWEAAQAADR